MHEQIVVSSLQQQYDLTLGHVTRIITHVEYLMMRIDDLSSRLDRVESAESRRQPATLHLITNPNKPKKR